jgi:SulP family sulfate permease
VSGILLILASIALWVRGSFLITFVPTLVVGSLIFHLGFDLMKESLYDTWSVGMHPLEYATIVVIVGVMGIVGFTEGIMVGVILACIFFVVMYSRKSIIRETFTGSQLRSTVHRLYRQQSFLDKVGNQIHIIKLQGFMFFGTVNQLDSYIKELLMDEPHIRFIVLDFSLIGGIDYSGLETFQRIKRNLTNTSTHLVFCGSLQLENEFRISGIFELEEEEEESNSMLVHIFETLNDALEWCENYLLSTYYVKSTRSSSVPKSVPANYEPRPSIVPSTPREQQVYHAASTIIKDFPFIAPQTIHQHQPFRFLIQAISDADQVSDELLQVFGPEFEKLEFKKNEIVYLSGTDPMGLYIVENGELGLSITDLHGSKIVETLLPGTMVGELELFAEKPRICTLISLSNTTVWCLSKTSYKKLSKSHPHLMLEFVTKISVPFDAVRFYNTVHHWSQLR